MGASGIGALVGALLLASRQTLKGLQRLGGRFGHRLRRRAGGLLVLADVCCLSAVMLVPVGFAMMIEMGSSNTLIQSMVPDHLRGRVMSVYSMMFMGMAPIGSLLAGAAADRFGRAMDGGRRRRHLPGRGRAFSGPTCRAFAPTPAV